MKKALFLLGLAAGLTAGYLLGCGLGWSYHFNQYTVVRVRPLTGHTQILYLTANHFGWEEKTKPLTDEDVGFKSAFSDLPDATNRNVNPYMDLPDAPARH